MRKITLIILLCLIIPVWCCAQEIIITKKKSGSSCTTSNDSDLVTKAPTATGNNYTSSSERIAMKFTLAATTTVTEIQITCFDGGSGVGTAVITLEGDDAGVPNNSTITGSTVSRNASTLNQGETPTAENFTLSSPISLNSGTYWVVLGGTGTIAWRYGTSSGDTGYYGGSSSWIEPYSNTAYYTVVRGCQ